MTRRLLTADWQLATNARDAYRFDFIPWLIKLVKAEKIDELLILGDLTEEKDEHPAPLVNFIATSIYMLGQLCRVTIIQGNHDGIDLASPFFGFLGYIHGVRWIKRPIFADNEAYGREFQLPFRVHDKDWDGLDFESAKLVLTHNTFAGAEMAPGIRAEGIPLDVFPKGCRIFSGDLHIPQNIKEKGRDLTYVGSPYTVDFGDDYEGRVIILDKGGDYCQYRPYVGRQKRLVSVATFKDLTSKTAHLRKGDIVKVRVNLTPDLVERLPGIKKKIKEWGDKEGYVIHQVEPIMPKAGPGGRAEHPRESKRSDSEIMEDYGRDRDIPKDTLTTGMGYVKDATPKRAQSRAREVLDD